MTVTKTAGKAVTQKLIQAVVDKDFATCKRLLQSNRFKVNDSVDLPDSYETTTLARLVVEANDPDIFQLLHQNY